MKRTDMSAPPESGIEDDVDGNRWTDLVTLERSVVVAVVLVADYTKVRCFDV